MNFWLRIVLAVLATWRVTRLLAYEDGPWNVLAKVRCRLGHGFAGTLMDCFACLSFWVAAPLAFWVCEHALDRLVAWLALSGGACLLERVGHEPVVFEPTSEPVKEDHNHGLLRPKESGAQEKPQT